MIDTAPIPQEETPLNTDAPAVPLETPGPEPPKRNIFKILLFSLLGLIFVSSIATVAYRLGQKQTNQSQPTSQLTPTPTPDETVDWKTYTNNKYGFSFKYPEELSLKVEKDIQSEFFLSLKSTEEKISINVEPAWNKTLQKGMKPTKTIKINQISWELFPEDTYCDAGECFKMSPFYQTLKNSYHFAFIFNQETSNLTQILSTFKFLDEDQTNIPSEWQTFTNSNGYTLSFPKDMEVLGTGFDGDPKTGDLYVGRKTLTDKPEHLHIYVLPKTDPQYANLDMWKIAQNSYTKNISSKLFVNIIEGPQIITFIRKAAYQYIVNSKGFVGPYEEGLSYEGNYKVIIVENNNNYFLIQMTDTPEFNQILSTFKFLE